MTHGWMTKTVGLTLLSKNINIGGWEGYFTHKHSNLGFRTDSFRGMFFLESRLKIQVEEEEKEGNRR